jgi:hypothetical protein
LGWVGLGWFFFSLSSSPHSHAFHYQTAPLSEAECKEIITNCGSVGHFHHIGLKCLPEKIVDKVTSSARSLLSHRQPHEDVTEQILILDWRTLKSFSVFERLLRNLTELSLCGCGLVEVPSEVF